MRVTDTHVGGVLLTLSLLVLWHIQSFPDMPGQSHGPALFPGIAAFGLAVCSLLLMIQGFRRAAGASLAADSSTTGTDYRAVIVTIVGLFGYWLLVDRLGFLIAATVLLSALLWAYRVRPVLIAPIAVVAALLIHTAFFKLLKVPLPWGLLSPLAW